jgi:hypothetical protein
MSDSATVTVPLRVRAVGIRLGPRAGEGQGPRPSLARSDSAAPAVESSNSWNQKAIR